MRGAFSLCMFLIAGVLVGVQVMVAFFAGTSGDLRSLFYFTAIAALFLALGAWASPGDRSRQVAITLLAGATVCVASFGLILFKPGDGGGMFRLEQVPPSAFATGFANLALLYGASLLLLFRRNLAVSR